MHLCEAGMLLRKIPGLGRQQPAGLLSAELGRWWRGFKEKNWFPPCDALTRLECSILPPSSVPVAVRALYIFCLPASLSLSLSHIYSSSPGMSAKGLGERTRDTTRIPPSGVQCLRKRIIGGAPSSERQRGLERFRVLKFKEYFAT